jgi:hypothetical protein
LAAMRIKTIKVSHHPHLRRVFLLPIIQQSYQEFPADRSLLRQSIYDTIWKVEGIFPLAGESILNLVRLDIISRYFTDPRNEVNHILEKRRSLKTAFFELPSSLKPQKSILQTVIKIQPKAQSAF